MKEWLAGNQKVLINACLAGLWVGLATYLESKEVGWSALLSAGAVGLRFAIGLVARSFKGLPTIPVDE